MKVLVAGSEESSLTPERKAEFRAAAKALGAGILEAGHTLVVSSERPDTVDALAFDGAVTAGKPGSVKIYYHDAKAPPFKERLREVTPPLLIEYERVEGSWATGRVPQILFSDAIVILGGGQKSAQFAHLAPYLNKPYLPVPCFGGVSEELWPALKLHYRHMNALQNQKENHIETWSEANSVRSILEILEDLSNTNVFKERRSRVWPYYLVSILFALSGWITIFALPGYQGLPQLFGILMISAYLGSGVRSVSEARHELISRFTITEVLSTFTLSAILAFFMLILYLGGGLSINGDFKFLEKLDDPSAFRRLAVSMTLFGGAAGFLTDTMTKLLRNKLEAYFG